MLERKRNCQSSKDILDRLLESPSDVQDNIISFLNHEDFRSLKLVARKTGGNHISFRMVQEHVRYIWDQYSLIGTMCFEIEKDLCESFFETFEKYQYPFFETTNQAHNMMHLLTHVFIMGGAVASLPLIPFGIGNYLFSGLFASVGFVDASGYYLKNYLYRTFIEDHPGLKSLTPERARNLKF